MISYLIFGALAFLIVCARMADKNEREAKEIVHRGEWD